MEGSLRVGGVPEHFNIPWLNAIEKRKFQTAGLKVDWQNYASGTGAMMEALRSQEIDIAVALTEGIIADIINNGGSCILQQFITTPLKWGIHVAAGSSYEEIEELEGKKYAISRMGSGSHLMAYVDAEMRGWALNDEQLVVVGGLEGARKALEKGEADIFLWEKFMIQPYVENGEFRCLGERPTPWPCFMMVVNKNVLEHNSENIKKLQSVINTETVEFKEDPQAISMVVENFGLPYEDAATWFHETDWAENNVVYRKDLEQAMNTLYKLGKINQKVDPSELCCDLAALK